MLVSLMHFVYNRHVRRVLANLYTLNSTHYECINSQAAHGTMKFTKTRNRQRSRLRRIRKRRKKLII